MCLAVPGKILEIYGEPPVDLMARVSFGGIVKEVNLSFVPDAQTGDYVIVHVGFALSRVDETEARQVFEYVRQIGELEELAPDAGSGQDATGPAANGRRDER